MSHHQGSHYTGLTVFSFLAGAVTGAVIALLVAPRSGRETREMLAEYGEELRERCNCLPEGMKEQASTAVGHGKALVKQGKELIEKGSKLASQGKDYLEEKRKTLNDAIEAGKQAMAQEKKDLDQAMEDK
ncbi:MAG: YtxH domain-containing protein [Desulfobulbaceae bacterium]|nr:MAG: YtxH domain-containing protein [Desulfobulbaceae bacterium]